MLRYRRMQQLHQAADCHDGDDDGDDLQSADLQGADCDNGEGGL